MNLSTFPYITIVIPVYNRSILIQHALDSVLKQTFSNFEIIIIDDGSTDDLEEVLKLYSDPRLRIIKHLKNQGAAAARNTAIKSARGSLIAFLDSDDKWCSTKLEKQLNHFECLRQSDKNIMGSFTWFFLHRQNGLLELRRFPKINNWNKYFLLGCFISPGSTLLVDKKVFEDIGFYDESLSRLEDWDWLFRFSKKFNLSVCEIPLSHIYQGETPSYQSVLSAFQKIFQKHKKDLSFHEKITLISTGHIELYYSCRKSSLFKACGHFFLSIIMNPLLLKKVVKILLRKLNNRFRRKGLVRDLGPGEIGRVLVEEKEAGPNEGKASPDVL